MRTSEFRLVKEEGKSHGGRYFVIGALSGRSESKVGLITSKRVGEAVERNRVRRRMRELVRSTRPEWVPGVWFVVIARQAAVGASFDALRKEWRRLAVRAGVLL